MQYFISYTKLISSTHLHIWKFSTRLTDMLILSIQHVTDLRIPIYSPLFSQKIDKEEYISRSIAFLLKFLLILVTIIGKFFIVIACYWKQLVFIMIYLKKSGNTKVNCNICTFEKWAAQTLDKANLIYSDSVKINWYMNTLRCWTNCFVGQQDWSTNKD